MPDTHESGGTYSKAETPLTPRTKSIPNSRDALERTVGSNEKVMQDVVLS